MSSLNNPLIPYAVVEGRSSDAVAHLTIRVRSQNTGLFRAFYFGEMMKRLKDLINEIYNFGQLCKSNHLDSHSAAAAFFMFVSIVPVLILVLAIIPFTPITDANILSVLRLFLPEELDVFAVDIVDQLRNKSITALSVSAVVAMWSASRSLFTIKRGLDEIRSANEKRNVVLLRLNAAFYTLVLIVSFILMLTMNVIFTGIERYFREVMGIEIAERSIIVSLVVTFRPIITIVLGFIVNLYLFTFLPNEKIKIKSQIPGAILVSIAWYICSVGFRIYINNFNAYSMYGSLSVVIIVLFWLYASMYILFLGGQFNYYLSLERENNKI